MLNLANKIIADNMNTRTQILESLREVKSVLLADYPIKELALFGSVSRADDNEESDVDILVEFMQPVGMEFIELAYRLEKILNRKVDLVSKHGIKEKYFNEIKSELIYV